MSAPLPLHEVADSSSDVNLAAVSGGIQNLHERMAPLLFKAGAWVSGGLIAADVIIIPGLISLGSVDHAIAAALFCFVCALPVNVAGLAILKLIGGLQDFDIEEVTLQAFRDAEFNEIDAYFPEAEHRARLRRRRFAIGLSYAAGLAGLGAALTVAGLVAALLHIGAWVAAAFVGALVVSAAMTIIAVSHAMPPDTPEQKALKRRFQDAQAARR